MGQLGGQLDREAIGVVQHEGVGRRDRGATLGMRALDDVVEQGRTRLERRVEALLLGLEQPAHIVAMLDERRMERPELLDDEILQTAQEGALEPDPRAVLHRPADDPPQDVAAALVRRDDAVGGEHRHRAAVIRQHAERLLLGALVRVARTRPALDGGDDVAEDVGLVHRVDALEQRGDALEACPGVDVLLRQRRQEPVGAAVVLHEDEVPVLEEPVARAAWRAVRPVAAMLDAPVVVQLGARAARDPSARPPRSCRRRARRCARPAGRARARSGAPRRPAGCRRSRGTRSPRSGRDRAPTPRARGPRQARRRLP